jgi:hypothetical protein
MCNGLAGAAVADQLLTIETHDPAGTIATVMRDLGSSASQVCSIELLRPSLESVFVALTGQRYSIEEIDVAAA